MTGAGETRYGRGRRIGLVLGPALFALVLALPPPPHMATDARDLLAVILLMATWWMTEAVPLAATSLVPLAAFPLLGILGAADAATPYADPNVFLFLGGFLLAKGFERSGLHRRVALRILAATGTSPRRVLLGIMLATAVISMWVSNTATAMMMLPIGAAVAGHAVSQRARTGWRYPFPTVLMLGVAYAASIGGVATLIGTPPNVLFAGQVRALTGESVGFLQWMLIGAPLAAALLAFAWLYLAFVAWDGETRGMDRGDAVAEQRRALGPWRREEAVVLVVFLSTVAAWVFRADIDVGGFVLPGWATRLGLDVHDGTIAIAAGLLLFLIPLDLARGEFILDWPTAVRLPWEVLLLFGAGFAIGAGFRVTQLGEWIAAQLTGLSALPTPVILLALSIVVVAASEIASNTALTGLVLPLLAASAPAIGVEPVLLMLTATLAASCGFMLPVATPPNAVAYATGHVAAPQMMRAGFALDVVGAVLVAMFAGLLAPLLF